MRANLVFMVYSMLTSMSLAQCPENIKIYRDLKVKTISENDYFMAQFEHSDRFSKCTAFYSDDTCTTLYLLDKNGNQDSTVEVDCDWDSVERAGFLNWADSVNLQYNSDNQIVLEDIMYNWGDSMRKKTNYSYNSQGLLDTMKVFKNIRMGTFSSEKVEGLLLHSLHIYTYDSARNLIREDNVYPQEQRKTSTTYQYNRLNQLVEELDDYGLKQNGCVIDANDDRYEVRKYKYDKNGFLTLKTKQAYSKRKDGSIEWSKKQSFVYTYTYFN